MGLQERILVKSLSCSRHGIVTALHKELFRKVSYFWKIFSHTSLYALLKVALVSIPPQKFVRPPY